MAKESGPQKPPIPPMGVERENTNTIKNVSRRDFIKKAGVLVLGAGAMFTSNPTEENDNPTSRKKLPGEKRETIGDEIEKCKQIIKNEQYGEIIKNPYLVSTLYYSPYAIEKMGPPHQNNPEKIIWSIYPLITKQFRENYISTLKRIFLEKGIKPKENNSNTQSLPLETISFGKNLRENHLDAIDLFIKESSPIYSMSRGLVVLAENSWKENDDRSTSSNRGGNTVIVFNPDDGSFYRYAHMQEVKVTAGMVLKNGEPMGTVGHTGINASEPGHGEHLHLEINRYDRRRGEMVPASVFELKKEIETLEHS